MVEMVMPAARQVLQPFEIPGDCPSGARDVLQVAVDVRQSGKRLPLPGTYPCHPGPITSICRRWFVACGLQPDRPFRLAVERYDAHPITTAQQARSAGRLARHGDPPSIDPERSITMTIARLRN